MGGSTGAGSPSSVCVRAVGRLCRDSGPRRPVEVAWLSRCWCRRDGPVRETTVFYFNYLNNNNNYKRARTQERRKLFPILLENMAQVKDKNGFPFIFTVYFKIKQLIYLKFDKNVN